MNIDLINGKGEQLSKRTLSPFDYDYQSPALNSYHPVLISLNHIQNNFKKGMGNFITCSVVKNLLVHTLNSRYNVFEFS